MMMTAAKELDPTKPDDLLEFLKIEWFYSTKEKLSPDDVLKGLLDHGLFAEKSRHVLPA